MALFPFLTKAQTIHPPGHHYSPSLKELPLFGLRVDTSLNAFTVCPFFSESPKHTAHLVLKYYPGSLLYQAQGCGYEVS